MTAPLDLPALRAVAERVTEHLDFHAAVLAGEHLKSRIVDHASVCADLRALSEGVRALMDRVEMAELVATSRAHTLARIGGHAVVEDAAVPRDEIWWRNERGEYLGKLIGLDLFDAARTPNPRTNG